MRIFVLAMVATLFFPWSGAFGQTKPAREVMTLGSVSVYLGEPRADAFTALVNAGYEVSPFGENKTSFTVATRNGQKFTLIGTFSVGDERLNFINKPWNPEEGSGYEFAKAVFYASQSLNQQGCENVQLTADFADKSTGQYRRVVLLCEGTHRRLEISTFDLPSGSDPSLPKQSVAIQEILDH